MRVCGTCSAVAIRCVTKVGSGRDSRRLVGEGRAGSSIGTSATQAGLASVTSLSMVCSCRSVVNIASRNLNDCHVSGHRVPCGFEPRKSHALASLGFLGSPWLGGRFSDTTSDMVCGIFIKLVYGHLANRPYP